MIAVSAPASDAIEEVKTILTTTGLTTTGLTTTGLTTTGDGTSRRVEAASATAAFER